MKICFLWPVSKQESRQKHNLMENCDMIKTKYASLFITATAFMVFCAGCAKEEAVTSAETDAMDLTEAAPPAPAEAETIDLTETPDLFEKPLQANPLAPQPEDVVVTVNGTDITHGEIMQAVQTTMMQLSQRMPPQQLQQMYGQVFQEVTDSLIANVLLTDAAETSTLAVSDAELNEEIDNIKASAPEGQSLEDALAANGIDYDEWTEDLRKQMLVGKFVEAKTADIAEASDEEVVAFYQENIERFKTEEPAGEAAKAEAKAQLEKIKADIVAGTATFEDMAKEYSSCPSGAKGGDLGSFGRGQMVPEFETAAFAQDVGVVGDIVETQFGYHIIKVTERSDDSVSASHILITPEPSIRTQPLEEVQEQLKGYLSGQKKQEALVAYVGELREGAEVVLHEQDLDAGSAE